MKTEIRENEHGMEINIIPESVEDFAQLARFANNAKKEPATIYLSFSNIPYLSVWMKKREKSKQYNSIRPYSK